MFTNTPDGHFIIDQHPDHPQVSFASPCSGHGFKFVSVLGEIMADLAERGETRHNIELFRLERFARGAQRLPHLGDRAGHSAHGVYQQSSTQSHASVLAAHAADTIRPFW